MVMTIPLSQIEPVTVKPSAALVKSIQERGVLVPILVVRRGDLYCLRDGRRRVAAARKVELPDIPAVVLEEGGPEITILAHATRSENPVAELQAIQELIRAGMSEEQIARAGYASLARIRRLARLNRLRPEIAERVTNGEVAPGVAFRIAALAPEVQAELARQEKITAAAVHESRSAQRRSVLPGLESVLQAGVRTATVEELFAELSDSTLLSVLSEIPLDERFAAWRGKIESVLGERAVPACGLVQL